MFCFHNGNPHSRAFRSHLQKLRKITMWVLLAFGSLCSLPRHGAPCTGPAGLAVETTCPGAQFRAP